MIVAEPLVVDSSIAVKWFKTDGEDHVEAALDLLGKHGNGDLILTAPAHMPAEVLNGLRYADYSLADLHAATKNLELAKLLIIPIEVDLLTAATDLALAYNLTVYDALFPALAVHFECSLVTADRAQARVCECDVRLLA